MFYHETMSDQRQEITDGFFVPPFDGKDFVKPYSNVNDVSYDKLVMPSEMYPGIDLNYDPVEVFVEFIKDHPKAQLPTKAYPGDTGFDVYCVEDTTIGPGESKVVPVGLKLGDITPGYWIMIECRSGLGFKHNLTVHNGVIDNGYRGSLDILVRNLDKQRYYTFREGDKVAQLVIHRNYRTNVGWTDVPTTSYRDAKGFGSSGK